MADAEHFTSDDGESRVTIKGIEATVAFKRDNAWRAWRTGRITARDDGRIAITFTLRKGGTSMELEQAIHADVGAGTFTVEGGGWCEE